jgi:hypothetical protein
VPTVEGVDPETGEKVRLLVYERDGVVIYERLSSHLTDFEKATPRQLEARAAFAERAYAAFDQRMTGSLPPAAEAVRALRRDSIPKRVRPERVRTQERYRQMVPPEVREQAERVARLKVLLAENRPGVGGKVQAAREPAEYRSREHLPDAIGTDHPMSLLVEAQQMRDRSGSSEHPLKALLEVRPHGFKRGAQH